MSTLLMLFCSMAPQLANTQASCTKQAAPKGLPLTTKVHWTICLSFAIHALCLVTKPCLDVVIRKIDEHQNHLYMLCEALSDA